MIEEIDHKRRRWGEALKEILGLCAECSMRGAPTVLLNGDWLHSRTPWIYCDATERWNELIGVLSS